MKLKQTNHLLRCAVLMALGFAANPAHAVFNVQCPGDTNGDADWSGDEAQPAKTKCMHLTGGDGFTKMADGTSMYTFGFANLTGTPALAPAPNSIQDHGLFHAAWPAPTIMLNEGDEFYLTLSNLGMTMRPDLFDPHSVHFHGFPQASAFFDGEPESTFGVNMGGSVTYYYNIKEPGTYLYHCHVEAAEHMQMGMLGNLYVHPAQDGTNKTFGGKTYSRFVFNDGDGSTGYTSGKEFPLQLSSFDSKFHEANLKIQLAPGVTRFANMKDDYAMINGRGYPDSVAPLDDAGNGNMRPKLSTLPDGAPAPVNPAVVENDNDTLKFQSQKMGSKVTAKVGDKVLLRISSVSVTEFFTVTAQGLPMQVVGQGARILRSGGHVNGSNLYFNTGSVTLGGGEANEVLVDTSNVAPGTYFLYTTNLNHLSNGHEDNGGMMTEIEITL